MNLKQFLNEYTEYNAWANKRIAEWVKHFENDKLVMEVKSSYASIYKTIVHIITTEKFWSSKIAQLNFEAPKAIETDRISYELISHSESFLHSIKKLSVEEFNHKLVINLKTKTLHLEGEYLICDLIQHCINHSTYHRGQLITIARNLNIETPIPSTDFFIFKMEKQNLTL